MSDTNGWPLVPLIDLIDAERPITYGILKPGPHIEAGVPYVRVVDIQDGHVRTKNVRRTSETIAQQYQRSKLNSGDVLLSIRGHVGRVAIVPDELNGANITQDTARLAPNEKLDARFLFWAFSSCEVRHWMSRRIKGVAVTGINLGDIKELPIPLPTLSEQKRIADILDKADAIRRKRQSALASIEEVIQSTFMQTVGPAADSFSSWPVKEVQELVASHKGAMRTGPFGSTLKHSEFVDSGIAVLGIDNAVKNRFAWDERRFISHEKYEDLKVYTVHPGDVLITIMATTGRSAVVPDDIPLAINTKHLACITLDRRMAEPEFISQAIHRHPLVLTQLGASGRGAIMNGLNLGIIKRIKIPTPPIELQREFARSVTRLRQLEGRLQAANNEGENLFNSLVQRAFKGDL